MPFARTADTRKGLTVNSTPGDMATDTGNRGQVAWVEDGAPGEERSGIIGTKRGGNLTVCGPILHGPLRLTERENVQTAQ